MSRYVAGEKLNPGDRVSMGPDGRLVRSTGPVQLGFSVRRAYEAGEIVESPERVPDHADWIDHAARIPMSLERAREILEEAGFALGEDSISGDGADCFAKLKILFGELQLEGSFTADQLEALAVWMRAHQKEG